MALNSSTFQNSLDAASGSGAMYNYTHPDYRYYSTDWAMIRDAMAGERRVKDMAYEYLPKLGDNAGTTYEQYRSRASFVNMTARTVHGLVGALFRRHPRVLGLSAKLVKLLNIVTPEGASFRSFAKTVAYEITQVGRVGVLVDMDTNGSRPPYFTHYNAENILAWKTEMIDGVEKLTYVLLREIVDEMKTLTPIDMEQPGAPPAVTDAIPIKAKGIRGNRQTRVKKIIAATPVPDFGNTQSRLRARYRVLSLRNGVYRQEMYETSDMSGVDRLSLTPASSSMPTYRGQPLDFIPFVIIGTEGAKAKVTKSPIIDICNLNYAHYRTSAQLEHGRYFTALPVYYVPVKLGEEGAEYTVGPSVVWEVPGDTKPGILEYYGTGLKELANSLAEKESHISQLGGKLFGIDTKQGSQAPEVAAQTQANEMSILMTICDAVSDGLTRALRWWAKWQDVDDPKLVDIQFLINRDFASSNIGAREMRAIATLYQSGIIPVEELHRVFQEAELISDDTTVEDFTAALKDAAQFPNQPNIEAMGQGYPDAAGRLQWNIAKLGVKAGKDTATKANDHAMAMADKQHEQNMQVNDQTHQQDLALLEAQGQQKEDLAAQANDHQTSQTRLTQQFQDQNRKSKP